MAENLKNTVLIENTEYNINAVYSDTAGKVAKSLKVKSSGVDKATFDGSQSVVIDHVSAADGGKFSNAVLIDNKYGNIAEIPEQAIVNFGQINSFVSALKKAPVQSWKADQLVDYKSTYNTIGGINTVVGTTEDFETFKRLLGVPKLFYTSKSSELYYGLSLNNNGTGKCLVGSYDKNLNYTDVFIPAIGYPSFDSTAKALYLDDKRDLTCIGANAFNGNTKITKVFIPESVTEIKNNAFDGCTALKTIRLPSKLAYISGFTFRNCTSLESIIIGANVTVDNIESSAFNGCTSLNKIYYAGTEDAWNAIIASIKAEYPSVNGTSVLETITNNKNVVFNYQYTPEFIELPCIYVCTDNTSSSLNKIFLKMPNEAFFVELSRGATYLESTLATSKNSYTYEGLAEIIARINARLDALGIPVTETVLAPEAPLTLDKVNALIPDVEITNDINPSTIPTIESLAGNISNLDTAVTKITNGTTTVGKATKDSTGRTISTGYYRSYNTSNVNTITISTASPDDTSGNIGDIWIKYE